jgi:hypothetical protein
MENLRKYGVEAVRLQNGMKLIVKHLCSGGISGLVAVKCGSAYETKGVNNGISHLLEHLIYSSGIRHSRRSSPIYKIEKTGGNVNPTTSKFWTEYPFDFLQKGWKRNFRMLLHAISGADFSKAIFLQEQKIVANEKSNDTDDLDIAMENRLFPRHPMGLPIDGVTKTVSALTPRRLKNWHRRFYCPNRITIVIVGETTLDEVLSVIKKTPVWSAPCAVIAEPQPVSINWDAVSEVDGVDTNAMRMVFQAPAAARDIVFLTYIIDIINDLSVVSMRWKIIEGLGLHEGMGIDEDKNMELNEPCPYFSIDFWAPSQKVLKKMELAFFYWVKKVLDGGISNDIFLRTYNQRLEEIRLGANDERWWRKILAEMVTQNFLGGLDIFINPEILGPMETKKEVERVFRSTIGEKHIVFRSHKG